MRDFAGKVRATGFGTQEINSVFTHLGQAGVSPIWATASRRIHRSSNCEVWSLSPDDKAKTSFLNALCPSTEQGRGIGSLTPNELSVALLVRFHSGISCLFGADLERRGWTAVSHDSTRPRCKSSVFKIPHHGSANAHVESVWDEFLEPEPIAILTPWRRGGGALPKKEDVTRILARTPDGYATTNATLGTVTRDRWVKKRLKKVGARIAPESGSTGMIRLRRSMEVENSWRVDLFGSACRLNDFAA